MPVLNSSGRYENSSIELRTRANTAIDNLQVWEHSRMEWDQLAEPLARFTKAERVSEACPVYNCHGLTFSSRRTQVTHSVLPILDADGFDPIPEKEARAGDIVLHSNARGEVVHSGFVVARRSVEIIMGSQSIIPLIWSKWGKGYEMIHSVGDCPYLEDEGNYATYYRLQRWKPA
ncbi:MAG: hypothetical protein WAM04_11030 [Candidatus Sulfotelmatobacter sp.]